MSSRLRAFKAEDAEYIIQNMRSDDQQELAALGLSPSAGIELSVLHSHILLTGLDREDRPAFILGSAPLLNGSNHLIWLLGTDAIEREPRTFLLHSKPALDMMFEITKAKTFCNYVWKANTIHIKWLKWLGFHLAPEVEGPNKDFIFFYKTKE